MNQQKSKLYAARLQNVLKYIEHNLDQDLTVDQLCSIAHFSKFHFHRQFANYIGMTVARYVLLLRLRQASYRIAFEETVKIIDIAFNAGFESSESFTRAFKMQSANHLLPLGKILTGKFGTRYSNFSYQKGITQ